MVSLTPIPKWMQQEVFQRDGAFCLSCYVLTVRHPDGKVRPDTLTFDHIVPECKRGKTEVDNLQVLCSKCNRTKGRQVIDFRPRPTVPSLQEQVDELRRRREIQATRARRKAYRAKHGDRRGQKKRLAEALARQEEARLNLEAAETRLAKARRRAARRGALGRWWRDFTTAEVAS